MIVILFFILVISCVVYLASFIFFKNTKPIKRLLMSAAVFVILSALFTTIVVLVGDRPREGSIHINLDDIDNNTGIYKTDKTGK